MNRKEKKKNSIILIITLTILFLFKMNVKAESALSEGTYILRSAIDRNYVIDLLGGNTSNGSNIQLYKSNNTKAQEWSINKNKDASYTISTSYKDNMAIDVYGGLKSNGTNIQLYKLNKSNAQRWTIVKNGGYYSIISELDENKCLDLSGAKVSNFSNIQLYQCNNTKAQQWILEKKSGQKEQSNLDDGVYEISNSINDAYKIDLYGANTNNLTNIQLYKSNKTKAQQWRIEKNFDNSYKISTELNNNKVIDVFGGLESNGTNIQLYQRNNTDAQKWKIYKNKFGDYNIISKLNNYKCLDLSGANVYNSSNIQLYQCNDTKAQSWKISKVNNEDESKTDNVDNKYVPENDISTNFSNLVLFVKFKDDTRDIFNAKYTYEGYNTNNWTNIKNMFNKNIQYTKVDDSFKKYIDIVTNGKVKINNIFLQQNKNESYINTYTLNGNESDYSSGDAIVEEISDALKSGKINNNFGNIKYDNVDNGILDNLMIIIQGHNLSDGDVSSLLVNHKTDYCGNKKIHGLAVSKYIILNSSSLVTDDATIGASQSGSGVISHEFLHVLGLPDLYRKGLEGVPVGFWDIMGSVSYIKQFPLSYFRAKNGWIESKEITKSGRYTLNAISKSNDDILYILKTPLSDSEYIVLEYRKKAEKFGEIDYGISSSGLLAYRIDTKVDDLSNIAGKNYVYVYRPNVTTQEAATDATYRFGGSTVNNIYNATIDPDSGEYEYGSTDLTAKFYDNTLYYSDGTNSGIKISNIKYSTNKNSISFDIDFANYKNNNVWDSLGQVSSEAISDKNDIYLNDNKLYTSYYTSEKKVIVKKEENGKLIQVGNKINNAEISSLIAFNNQLYIAVRNSTNYGIDLYSFQNNRWIKIESYDCDYAQDITLFQGNNTIYLGYNDTKKLNIVDIINSKVIATKSFEYLSNPKLTYYNNKIYLAYSDYLSNDNKSKLISSDLNGIWEENMSLDMIQSNIHDIKVYNKDLYALYGKSGQNPILVKCNDNTCSIFNTIPIKNYLSLSLNINSDAYISYISNTSDNQKTYVLKLENNTFRTYNDNLGTGLTNLKIINDDNNLYALVSISNSLYIKKKKLE